MKRRILSIITALALCLSLCPTWALAAEADPSLCKHHQAHTEDCGYTAPTEGQPCGHEHTAECYTLGVLPDADSGNPYEVGGDTENLLDCQHSHNSECGYVEADPGTPCGYECRICPIEDLIAALPNSVTEGNADDVRAQLDEILALYRELTEDEQEQVDLSRVTELQGALDTANMPTPVEECDHKWVKNSGEFSEPASDVITVTCMCEKCNQRIEIGTLTLINNNQTITFGQTPQPLEVKVAGVTISTITWENDRVSGDGLNLTSPRFTPQTPYVGTYTCTFVTYYSLGEMFVPAPDGNGVIVNPNHVSLGRYTASFTLTVNPLDLSDSSVTATLNEGVGAVYNGSQHRITASDVTVTIDGTPIPNASKYYVAFQLPGRPNAQTDAGAYPVVVVGGYSPNSPDRSPFTGERVAGTYTIEKATPIVEWPSGEQELTYNGQPVNIRPAISLKDGGTFNGSINYSYAAEGSTEFKDGWPTDAGRYTIKASIPEQQNYKATEAEVTLTIKKMEQGMPDEPTAAEITDTSITLTEVVNAEYSIDGTNWQDSPVFTGLSRNTQYTFHVRLKADANHNASPSNTASITTGKTSLTGAKVTVSGNYTYTGAAIVPAAENVTVVLNGATVNSDQYTITVTNNTNAGTATLTVTAKADGDYSGSVSSTFTIAKASLTITANPQTITYGGSIAADADHVARTGLCAGDTLESVTLEASTSNVPGGNITPSAAVIKRGDEDVTANYDITYETGALTINPAPVTLTFNDHQTITYGGAPTGATANPASAKIEYSYTTEADGTPISGWPTNAGTYTVTAKVEATGNYGAAIATAQLTINKAALTIESATVASKTYDTTKTAAVSGVTFTGLKNGETLALGTDYTATGTFADANTGEGKSVTVTVTLAGTAKANNYTLASTPVNTTGTITKADPVVTNVSVSSSDPIYESTSLSDIALTHGEGDPEGTVELNPGQTLTAGTKGYAWTFTPTDTNNYNTATGTISLTVAVDTLQSISVTTPPAKTAYTYGESFDKAGMVVTAAYASGAAKVVTGEVQISPAELTVTTTALTITYQGKTVTQEITVSPKEVTNPTIELSSSSFVYDGTGKEPAVTVKDGEKVIPADEYTVAYSDNINVGTTATVTITDKDGGNYAVSGSTTFTITAKPLTGAKVEVTGPFTYTGSAQEPAPTVTLGGKPLVKDTDYTVAYADNTNAGTAKITVTGTGNYSGTAQGTFTIGKATLTVEGTGIASGTYGAKLPELAVEGLTAKLNGNNVAGTWKLAGDTVPNVGDSGEYTATFTPTSGADNYNALEAQVTLNIAKADYTGTTTASTSAKFGTTGTYDLSALLPDGATAGTATTTSDIFEGAPAVSGKTLTYKLAESAAPNATGTITVPVTSANYNDFNLTVTVKVTDKDVPTLTVSPITVTYSGEAIPGTAIKGTAKVGSTTVPGTWAFASGEAVTNVADSGTKTVKFVPTDGTNYAEATATVVVTIKKATPTGAPKYTAISTSGKTLADAGLTTEGGTFSTTGTVAWALGTDTAVTANTQYEWTFTPSDAANYNTLTGKITLWVQSTGGGSYVPSGPSSPGTSTLPVTTTGQGSTTTTTAAPTATTQGGTATTTINTTMGQEIVKQAVANNSETVVIAPKVTGSVTKAEVSIPASTVGQIGSQTNASLTVSTPVADVTIPNGGLGSLSSAGGTVTVTAERTGNSLELTVTAGDQTVQNVPGGVTLTVPAASTTPGTVAVLVHEDGTREVVRKSVADNGAVTIPLDGSAKLEIVDNSGYFADVPATSWEADAVAFASSHELFNGTAPGQFSPNTPMSRGMLAVVLHNLESNPAQALTGAFTDVDNSQWYAEGVAWAEAQGIIGGYGNGQFGPNDNITREQLAVMLWRYAGSPAATDRELHFADAHRASDWALEALRWATEKGIINGKGGGILDPTGQATRAETAQMLKNFMENQ